MTTHSRPSRTRQASCRRRRALASAGALLLASAVLTACAGGGGDDSSDSTVTVWASVDQPIIDGFQEHFDAAAKEAGITIKMGEGREHQPADHDQDPVRRHPGHRVDPPAGRRGRHRQPGAA